MAMEFISLVADKNRTNVMGLPNDGCSTPRPAPLSREPSVVSPRNLVSSQAEWRSPKDSSRESASRLSFEGSNAVRNYT